MIDQRRLRTAMIVALLAAAPGLSAAQPAQKAHTLSVATKDGLTEISLNAEAVKLSEIAADLAKQLKARVILGPTMENETITVKFSNLLLEPTLRALAPRVLVDYEIRQGAQPTPLGIYLLGFTDPEPARTEVVKGMSQGLLISGNTEDTGRPSKDDPLQVTYERSRLTLVSKQQPLLVVVMTIADTIGVPAEIKYEDKEMVTTALGASPPDDILVALSPNVRVYVRVDANRLDRVVLRISLVPPAAK